jgi:hypothetical protein
MSAKALPDRITHYQGRTYHQQRDLTRRPRGRPLLHTQTWIYRGAPDAGGTEWPESYSHTARPVPSVAGMTDAQLFTIFCDLNVPTGSPLLAAVEDERFRRLYAA